MAKPPKDRATVAAVGRVIFIPAWMRSGMHYWAIVDLNEAELREFTAFLAA